MAPRAKKKPAPRSRKASRRKKAGPSARRAKRGVQELSEAQVMKLLDAGWIAPVQRPVGRPRKQLDEGMIERLAAMFHTQQEIATLMQVSVDTIADNYSEAYYRGREQGKSSIRKAQLFRGVVAGSDRMLIWIGKQELGQKDRHELSGDADAPLVFEPIVPGAGINPPGAAPEPK